MLSLALSFALLSSLGWAGLDVVRKHMVRQMAPEALVVLLNLVQLPGFSLWVLVDGRTTIHPGYLKYLAGSLLLNLAANLLFLKSVRRSPLSATIPLLALTPVFTALVGASWSSERPSSSQWLGITCVVAGAFMLNATPLDFARPARLLGTILRERGSLYMAAVAALWSVAPFFDKQALALASAPLHAVLLSGGVAGAMLLFLVASRSTGTLRNAYQLRTPLALSALSACAGFGFQLLAIQLMWISLFEALKRALGMSLSVVSGRIFFGERVHPLKLASVAAMALGVLLLI